MLKKFSPFLINDALTACDIIYAMTHQCIKPGCPNKYEDDDIDAFYCPSCIEAKQAIADELDAKFNTTGQVPSSALADYDRARGTRAFPRASDLGIKI